MLFRRDVLVAAAGVLAAPWVARAAVPMPGVTKTAIKIGQTMPYSGPASAYGAIGRTKAAFFNMLNAAGGINGRTIEFLSADDGYSPPRTVEETRRLVEAEGVAFMGTVARLGMWRPVGYFHVCSLAEGGCVAWMLRRAIRRSQPMRPGTSGRMRSSRCGCASPRVPPFSGAASGNCATVAYSIPSGPNVSPSGHSMSGCSANRR